MNFVEKILLGLVASSLVAAPINALAQAKGMVGIAMPTKTSPRWVADGNNMLKIFKERGYETDMQYAEDDISNQISQMESMIAKGAKVLVVGAIDGSKLSKVLQKAADKGIIVISYDRLIRDTKNIDYYVTFDNFQIGVLQGTYIEKALNLKSGKGPFNIELFGGSNDDNNARFYYDGALSILKPYIDKGKLVVRSKQVGMDKVATLRWDASVAQARMDTLLTSFYSKDKLDAVLSPNDGLAIGIIAALKGAGYGRPEQAMPVVTGQDAEIISVKSIIQGEQGATIFKDTRELAKVAANMVDTVLQGKAPKINDTKTYNNGVKIVPTFLLKPVIVEKSNWKEILVTGSGYYTEAQLK